MPSRNAPKDRPQATGSLLQAGSTQIQRARALAQLDASLAATLPENMRPYVRLGNIRGGSALIVADSGAWAVRARILVPQITRHLRDHCGLDTLKRVRVIVQPQPLFRQLARPQKKRMSSASAQAIQSLAERVEHEGLRSALQRLARHGKVTP